MIQDFLFWVFVLALFGGVVMAFGYPILQRMIVDEWNKQTGTSEDDTNA